MAQAQNRPLGTWKSYLSYKNGQTMIEADGKVYVGTEASLYFFDNEDNSLNTRSTVDGLSDLNIKSLGYHESSKTIVVAYNNANIDLMSIDGKIVNVSDVNRANILKGKTINHVEVVDDFAYLACGFGIVYLDILKAEIKDTYIIGSDGSQIEVYQVAASDDIVMAATEEGIYKAPLNSGSLTNFNNWELQTQEALIEGAATAIVHRNGKFYASIDDFLFRYEAGEWSPQYADDANYRPLALRVNGDKLIMTSQTPSNFGRIVVFDANEQAQIIGNFSGTIRNIQESTIAADGTIWGIDFWRGLHHIDLNNTENPIETMIPEGPFDNGVFNLEVVNNELFVMPGGVNQTWSPRFLKLGFYHHDGMGDWTNFGNQSTPPLEVTSMIDFIHAKKHPSLPKVYMASFGGGLVEFDYENFTIYDDSNSSIQFMIPDVSSARYRISGIDFDSQQNMWISNFGAPQPISVQTPEGEWYSFAPSNDIDIGPQREMISMNIDSYGQKWAVLEQLGMLVFNHGADLANSEDDFYLHLLETNGRALSDNVYSVALDLEGWMWIGTDKGAAYFTCDPISIQERNCQSVQPILEVDGFGALLLGTENVRAIAVDGANRKWFGTDNGVFLMSPDGTEQILRFTTDNSPLLDNAINDIEINNDTGEVFFGTNKGVISYKGDAIAGMSEHGEVIAYPNPVRPEYEGSIAIRGLAQNAVVKITDIGGNLMYETRALGGQAIWSGRDYTGKKAATGVYLIFSSNEEGTDTNVAKLLIVN